MRGCGRVHSWITIVVGRIGRHDVDVLAQDDGSGSTVEKDVREMVQRELK